MPETLAGGRSWGPLVSVGVTCDVCGSLEQVSSRTLIHHGRVAQHREAQMQPRDSATDRVWK